MSPAAGIASIATARQVVERAIAERIFPAASLEVGSSAGALWTEALGTLTFDRRSPAASPDTSFDLASLTKVVATTTVLMELALVGRLRLDEPVSVFFEEWRGTDRDPVTVRDLMEHASGLAARLIDVPPTSRREFEHEICRMPLRYAPRTQAIYSDLDFILLGFIAADRGGAPMTELFDQIKVRLPAFAHFVLRPGLAGAEGVGGKPDIANRIVHIAGLTFDLPADLKRLSAPTLPLMEDPRRGRTLAGEVHDNYAAALGGAAGHAGLFGTAPAVGAFARVILRAARGERDSPSPFSPQLVAQFTTKTTVPASSRALGWDTMLPSSSCGTRMSPRAFGHVGFTGTSLWIDPERDRYVVLLTNRAYGGGSLDDMRMVRRAFHDALGEL